MERRTLPDDVTNQLAVLAVLDTLVAVRDDQRLPIFAVPDRRRSDEELVAPR